MDKLTALINALGGRKFLLSVGMVLLVTFAIDVDPASKLDFMKWIAGIFVVGNVGQKAIIKLKE